MHSKGNANSRFGRLKAVGQVSFSSPSEFYACSERFRSSPIGLDSNVFLGPRRGRNGAGLKQNRRQVRASGFVVEPHRHQRHRLDNSEPTLKAPAEQPSVPSWD
jgi:hypothetical protein